MSFAIEQDEIMGVQYDVTGLSFTAVGLQPRTSYKFTVKGLVSNITEPSPPTTIVVNTSKPQG